MILNEEQSMIQEALRSFSRERLAPNAARWDKEHHFPKEELQELAEICADDNVIVFSDEIHADLTLPPNKHCSFATVSEEARRNSIVFMSPSKAFNMPGMASSYCIIENESIRRTFTAYINGSEYAEGNVFSFIGVAAAYSNGTEWLDQVIAYIQIGRAHV